MIEKDFEEISWLSQCETIPSWEQSGILHSFGGKNNSPKHIFLAKQVHGNHITEVSDGHLQQEEADGLATEENNIPIGVKTADCLPILVWTPRYILALHGGWKGLASGIIFRGISVLEEKINLKTALVALGPCIGPNKFEVGPEVMQSICSTLAEKNIPLIGKKGSGDRWYIDLAIVAILQLMQKKIASSQISVIRACTYENASEYHSFRRDKDHVGRNISWLALK